MTENKKTLGVESAVSALTAALKSLKKEQQDKENAKKVIVKKTVKADQVLPVADFPYSVEQNLTNYKWRVVGPGIVKEMKDLDKTREFVTALNNAYALGYLDYGKHFGRKSTLREK
jgi:hypothetical protein